MVSSCGLRADETVGLMKVVWPKTVRPPITPEIARNSRGGSWRLDTHGRLFPLCEVRHQSAPARCAHRRHAEVHWSRDEREHGAARAPLASTCVMSDVSIASRHGTSFVPTT